MMEYIFPLDFWSYNTYIFYGLLLAALIQISFYLFVYLRVYRKAQTKITLREKIPVSVIIAARDEARNLEKNLPLILEQEYKNFEVVVVDDCSADDTEEVLIRMRNKYPHLRSTFIREDNKFKHGKKLALTIGIKAAKNDHLLLTDADCYPAGKNWLEIMTSNFSDTRKVVLGYGRYAQKPGFLNKLIRFDTFFIALHYFGFASLGRPYMGVGRNLCYTRKLFFQNKGFASHHALASGDDDLFIKEVATKKNTVIELRPEAHTISQAKQSFRNWFIQKRRHYTTAKYYKGFHKFFLALEPFSRMLFYTGIIYFLIKNLYVLPVLSLFFIRLTLQLFTHYLNLKRLNEKNLLLISLVYDIFYPLIGLFLMVLNITGRKNNTWR